MSELGKAIEQQLAHSKGQRQTTDFIRQFVFTVVDRALCDHYGSNYSIRCMQSTFGILDVLSELGIKGRAWGGAVCVAGVTTSNPFEINWHGFWGDDHHIWAVTEHMELIDLTISQLHVHPASTDRRYEPMPAIWWNPIDRWPPVLKYLPDGVVKRALSADESADLAAFRERVLRLKTELIDSLSVDDVLHFEPILYGPDWANTLTTTGHSWLVKSLTIQDHKIPLPDWVAARERELMEKGLKRA
jgi:hypothetical protein